MTGEESDSLFEPTKRTFEIQEQEDRCVLSFNSARSRFELPAEFFGAVKGHSTDCILLADGCALVAKFSDTRSIKLLRIDKESNVEWVESISFRPEYGGSSGPCIPETLELVKSADSVSLFVARRGTSYIYRIDPRTGEELCSGCFAQLDSPE